MKKVTIHRALSELKLIDAKIEKAIQQIDSVGIYQKGKLVNGITSTEVFADNAKSKLQSALDLISQKSKIKTAIVAANAVTKLKVAEEEMTIADAITQKSSIEIKKILINSLTAKYNHVLGLFNKNNEVVNQNLQKVLEVSLGKDNVKAGENDVENIRKPFLTANEWILHDPLEIKNRIEVLEREVSDFEANVDAALSEINAVTFIEY